MNQSPARLLLGCVLVLTVSGLDLLSQTQPGKPNGPTGKIYVAEARGESVLRSDGRITAIRQATAFDAPGSVIETKANSLNALVYSNGTGLLVGENTQLEIKRFTQEPFSPDRNSQLDSALEPSISQSDVHISRGSVGLCATQMVSGSSMHYTTPHARINIRGGKISIESTATGTIIDLLEGDATIRPAGNDAGGQQLRPGERAIIGPPSPGGRDPLLTVQPIPASALKGTENRVSLACNARKAVTFEIIAQLAAASLEQTQEIVPKPTVPKYPPTNIVVSPDRLPGT